MLRKEERMRATEKSMEWLRPLVETKAWDYCIVWKFGDDPSRYIEWMGCCCSGSHSDCKNVKEESGAKPPLLNLCKDTYIKHSVRTNACERLARFPSSMSLYSGIHGEVSISNQPRWLSHESIGTQVLIPVVSGLIELFSAKHVRNDQKIIDNITARFNIFVEHENTCDPFIESHLLVRPHSITGLHFLSTVPHPITYTILGGSSIGSNPSDEHPSPNHSIGKSMVSLGCSNSAMEKEKCKARQKTGKEQYRSKNLVAERNRRNRLKDELFALRALVPKISKMDRAAIVGDAIEYIEELQKDVKKFQDELEKLAEEDWDSSNDELEIPGQKGSHEGAKHSPASGHSGGLTSADKQIEVQVQVHQIGARDFLLKFICNQKPGGFLKMMEAIDSLGLQVIDANITTCNGRVLNILKVEANGKEVGPKKLKDSFLASWSSQTEDGNSKKRS